MNASKNFNLTLNNKDEWLTQPELVYSLGCFDLDPCAALDAPFKLAKKYYTIDGDGFNQTWVGRVWLNPPYGNETFKWLKKLSEHGSGTALIFSRTETKGFHRTILDIGVAHSIFLFEGRLKFYERFYHIDDEWFNISKIEKEYPNLVDIRISEATDMKWDNPTPANAPSCLVSYSEFDTQMIEQALYLKLIKGRLLLL